MTMTGACQYHLGLSYLESQSKTMDAWRESGQLCDMQVQIGATTMFAHRVILAAASPYFASTFSGRFEDTDVPVMTVDLSKVVEKPSDLELVLKAVYTGVLWLDKESVVGVLHLSTFLMIDSIKSICKLFLLENLSLATCLRYYLLADAYSLPDLLCHTSSIMRSRFHDHFMLGDDLLQVSGNELRSMLQQNFHLHCSPVQLVRFLMQWAAASDGPGGQEETALELFSEICQTQCSQSLSEMKCHLTSLSGGDGTNMRKNFETIIEAEVNCRKHAVPIEETEPPSEPGEGEKNKSGTKHEDEPEMSASSAAVVKDGLKAYVCEDGLKLDTVSENAPMESHTTGTINSPRESFALDQVSRVPEGSPATKDSEIEADSCNELKDTLVQETCPHQTSEDAQTTTTSNNIPSHEIRHAHFKPKDHSANSVPESPLCGKRSSMLKDPTDPSAEVTDASDGATEEAPRKRSRTTPSLRTELPPALEVVVVVAPSKKLVETETSILFEHKIRAVTTPLEIALYSPSSRKWGRVGSVEFPIRMEERTSWRLTCAGDTLYFVSAFKTTGYRLTLTDMEWSQFSMRDVLDGLDGDVRSVIPINVQGRLFILASNRQLSLDRYHTQHKYYRLEEDDCWTVVGTVSHDHFSTPLSLLNTQGSRIYVIKADIAVNVAKNLLVLKEGHILDTSTGDMQKFTAVCYVPSPVRLLVLDENLYIVDGEGWMRKFNHKREEWQFPELMDFSDIRWCRNACLESHFPCQGHAATSFGASSWEMSSFRDDGNSLLELQVDKAGKIHTKTHVPPPFKYFTLACVGKISPVFFRSLPQCPYIHM